MNSISKLYKKCCVVPQCASTTIKTPEKLFINVPRTEDKRKMWLQLARKDPNLVHTKSEMYFCEDHFDLPNDMENYTEYQLMGSVSQIRLREDCLPTKFACQTDGKRQTDNEITPPLAVKRQRSEPIEECEIEQAHSTQSVSVAEVQPGPSSDTLDKSRSPVEFICQPIDTKRIKLELADPEDTQPLDSQDVKFEFTQFENDDDDTQNLIDSNDIPTPSTFIPPEGVTSIKQENFVMKVEIESEDFLEQPLTKCDNSDNAQSNPSTQTEQISNNEGGIQEEQQDNSSKESMSDTDTISQTDSKPKKKNKGKRSYRPEKRKRNKERGKARNQKSSVESCGALIIRNLPKDQSNKLPNFFEDAFGEQEFEYDYIAEMRDLNQMPTGQYILKFRPRSATEAIKEKINQLKYEGKKLEVLEGDIDNLVRWAIAIHQQTPQIIRTEKRIPAIPFDFSNCDKIPPFHYIHRLGANENDTKRRNHYGLKPEAIDAFDLKDVSLNRLPNQVKVFNLDPSMEHQHIREIFGMAGIVMNVNIYRTRHQSKNEKPPFPITALVEYDHPVEALQAISMFNGHEIYNRKLTVQLYRNYKRNTLPNGVGPTLGPGIGIHGRRLLGVRNFIELQEIRKSLNDLKSSFKGEMLPKNISDELASVKNNIRSEFYNELLGLMNEISTLRNELQTLKNEVQSRDNTENLRNDVPSEGNTATENVSNELRNESNKTSSSGNLESEYRHDVTHLKNEIEIICKINNLRRPKPKQPSTDTDTYININTVTNETQPDIVDSIEKDKENNQNSDTVKTNEQSTKDSNHKSTQVKQTEEQNSSQNKIKINLLDKKSTAKSNEKPIPKPQNEVVSIKSNAGDKTQTNTTKNKDTQKNASEKPNDPKREEILKIFKDLISKGSTAEELMDILATLIIKPTARKRCRTKKNVSQFDTGFNDPKARRNYGSQGFAGPRDAPIVDPRMDGPRPFMDPWLGRQDDRSYPGQMGRDPFETYGQGNMPPSQQYQEYSANCPPGDDIHQPTNPMHPPANPIHFSNNPLHPSTNPLHPPANPMHPPTNPMHPPTNPMHHLTNPMLTPTNAMQPPTTPMPPPANPMHSPTNPMHSLTNPIHSPTNSMHPPINPMHSLTNPMHPPISPIRPQMSNVTSSECQKPIRQTALVCFSNLPPKVTHAVLTDKLKEDFQSIQYVEFTSRGDKAIVRFLNKLEADRCIHKFNRSKVDGHIIDVKGL